jgi:general secretion pathway protein D
VNIKYSRVALILIAAVTAGCANNANLSVAKSRSSQQPLLVESSYLATELAGEQGEVLSLKPSSAKSQVSANGSDAGLKPLPSMAWPSGGAGNAVSLEDLLSTAPSVKVSADKMPLHDFLHYVLGDLLSVNYVFDQSVGENGGAQADLITLSLSEPVSPRELFQLSRSILVDRGFQIKHGSNTFFVFKPDSASGAKGKSVGVGREISNVPNTLQPILQMVPIEYGIKISLERNLRTFLNAKVTTDYDQGAVFIEGSRGDILQALDMIKMLDTPAARSKYIGLIELTFIGPNEFAKEVAILLENEGIFTAVGKPGQRSVVLVPLQQLGGVAVFASSEVLLSRVSYWSTLLDVPGKGTNEQYFLYHPKFARAKDLGESVSALLGTGSGSLGGRSTDNSSQSALSTGNAPSAARVSGFNSAKIKMVVDERANALVFYTSGSEYRALMPLLSKLDTLPKQVSLDIAIAEVTLQDEFKFGVEWALSRSEVNLTTQGAFGAAAVGGLGVFVNGAEGPLTGSFLNSNSLVKVLSNPTLMVRDGVQASINVGSDISVVGQTTQDPINGDRQTTSSEYRKTGVDVSVTPTVNAQGIVVMEVEMTISNSVPSSIGAAGNPDIFERLISTEVVAQSGQTILLGGLISENYSNGGSGAPGLSKIPLLGNLFKSKSDSADRTELIMLITPQVLDSLDRWNSIKDEFRQELKFMELSQPSSM